MISLNLGLLNLMPIPVLDGGHIAILAIEGLSRRDFSMKVKEKMLLAGFVLLLMLMVTVIYNDLTRVQWIEKLMPWRVKTDRAAASIALRALAARAAVSLGAAFAAEPSSVPSRRDVLDSRLRSRDR